MGTPEQEMAGRRSRRKLDAMRRRTGELRRRVVATAIVVFVVLWTVVFVQMATGNDPALGTAAPPARKQRMAPAAPRPKPEPEVSAASHLAAERLELEQQEAEGRELEELEAVTTGQS
jgi:hypothetical protein